MHVKFPWFVRVLAAALILLACQISVPAQPPETDVSMLTPQPPGRASQPASRATREIAKKPPKVWVEGFVQDPSYPQMAFYGLAFEGTGSFLQTDISLHVRAYDRDGAKLGENEDVLDAVLPGQKQKKTGALSLDTVGMVDRLEVMVSDPGYTIRPERS
jgi:hypothetical protein